MIISALINYDVYILKAPIIYDGYLGCVAQLWMQPQIFIQSQSKAVDDVMMLIRKKGAGHCYDQKIVHMQAFYCNRGQTQAQSLIQSSLCYINNRLTYVQFSYHDTLTCPLYINSVTLLTALDFAHNYYVNRKL